MYQGTQGYSLTKKTEGRKSRGTVSLKRKRKECHMNTMCWIQISDILICTINAVDVFSDSFRSQSAN
jgi:hypothetical protein